MYSKFLLEEEYNKFENQTKFDLSSSTPDALSLEELLEFFGQDEKDKIIKELLNLKLTYSQQFGLSKTCEKILQTLYSPQQKLLLTTGASEAIFLCFSALFEAGDKIIVQKPIYQALFQTAQDRGVEIIDWDYDMLQDFSTNLEQLNTLIKKHPEAKALVINNPNNPLGIGFAEAELKQISTLLEERMFIADEVNRGISIKELPSVVTIHLNSIAISDLSKSYSLPGLRLGWIVSNDISHIEKFSSLKNYLSLRSPLISEFLAEKVMDIAHLIADKNKNIVKQNLDYIFSIAALGKSQSFFECDFPQEIISGHTIFPKFIRDESFLDKLFNEKGIFVIRGKLFGDQYQNRIRIGLVKQVKSVFTSDLLLKS